MLALIPQSGDYLGAALGVRSVALLQVPKLVGNFRQKHNKFIKIFVYITKKYYLCRVKMRITAKIPYKYENRAEKIPTKTHQ